MSEHTARGNFDVKLTPQTATDAQPGRLHLEKTFHGDLSGHSSGEMLAVRTGTDGSAGYVAMEVVTGNLDGRHGSFALQHSGTMHRGSQSLSITVVPDSATGALIGLAGRMEIHITNGQHSYALHYTLPR